MDSIDISIRPFEDDQSLSQLPSPRVPQEDPLEERVIEVAAAVISSPSTSPSAENDGLLERVKDFATGLTWSLFTGAGKPLNAPDSFRIPDLLEANEPTPPDPLPLPLEAREAVAFAEELLSNIQVQPSDQFFASLATSTHPQFSRLTTHFLNQTSQCYHLARRYNEPWQEDDFLNEMDKLIKLAYTLSLWMVDDIDAFTKEVMPEKSYEEAITSDQTYFRYAFFFLPDAYHLARGKVHYSGDLDSSIVGLTVTSIEDPQYVDQFYSPDTLQQQWRTLYNDYCNRLYTKVDRTKLTEIGDMRFVRWSVKDTPEERDNFRPLPDTLPG